jgi:hypothetical protein
MTFYYTIFPGVYYLIYEGTGRRKNLVAIDGTQSAMFI